MNSRLVCRALWLARPVLALALRVESSVKKALKSLRVSGGFETA
jgi:hypothetical protein